MTLIIDKTSFYTCQQYGILQQVVWFLLLLWDSQLFQYINVGR